MKSKIKKYNANLKVLIAFQLLFFLFLSNYSYSEWIIKWDKWEFSSKTGQVQDFVMGQGRDDGIIYIYTIEFNLSTERWEINEYNSQVGSFSYAYKPIYISIGDGSGLGNN